MDKVSSHVLKFSVVAIGIIVLLISVFALPSLAEHTAQIHPEVAYLQYPVLLGMYATAIPFFYSLFQALKIIRAVDRDRVFSVEVAESLNSIKWCAFVILSLYGVGIVGLSLANALIPIILLTGFGIIIVTVMIAAFAVFLKNVLQKSVMLNESYV